MGDSLPFVNLGTGVKVASVALGRRHTCAIVDGGGVTCWGELRVVFAPVLKLYFS